MLNYQRVVTCVILCRTGGASHFLTVSVKDSIILPDWEPECWKESFGFAWICWLSELMHVDTMLSSLLINQYMSKQYLYGWYGYTQISSQLNTLVKLRLKLGGCIFKFVQDGWNHGSQYYWMCWRPQMSWKSYHVSSRSRLKIAKCCLHCIIFGVFSWHLLRRARMHPNVERTRQVPSRIKNIGSLFPSTPGVQTVSHSFPSLPFSFGSANYHGRDYAFATARSSQRWALSG